MEAPGAAPPCLGERNIWVWSGAKKTQLNVAFRSIPSLPQIKKRKCLFQIQEEGAKPSVFLERRQML